MSERHGGDRGREEPRSSGTVVAGVAVAVVAVLAVVALVLAGIGPLGLGGSGSTLGATSDATTTSPTPSSSGTGTGTGPTGTPGNSTPAPLPPGEPLEGVLPLAEADVVIEGEGDAELGYAVATGDVDGDGQVDVVVGDPFFNASGHQSGAVFVFLGPVAPGDLTVADADVRLTGESATDWAGNSVAVADVDGDGVGDLVVGAPRNDAGERNAGAVYVVHGGPALDGTVPLGEADARLVGAVPGSLAGYSVAAANVTGDGRADVVAGAPRGEGAPGHAYLVDDEQVASTTSLSEATATLAGEGPGDEAGWRVAVTENLTGDDDPAVVVGAPRNDAAGDDAGAAYVVATPLEGNVDLGDAALVLRGGEESDLAGWSVATAGDVDGDGRPDVIVGAPRAGFGGEAYVVDPDAGERSLANATALRGAPGDSAGWVVAGTADVTCDGRPDVLVGAPGNYTGGDDAGAAYVTGGDGPSDLQNATAMLVGSAGDEVGRADALATVTGRNTTGLVVGAPFGDPPQSAHVVYGACPDG
jgi:hypothetical protein